MTLQIHVPVYLDDIMDEIDDDILIKVMKYRKIDVVPWTRDVEILEECIQNKNWDEALIYFNCVFPNK